MPCPHGVDIPGNFRIFNTHSMYKNDGDIKWVIGNIEKAGKFADKCIECNECVPKCPQYIEIPTELSTFKGYLEEHGLKE